MNICIVGDDARGLRDRPTYVRAHGLYPEVC